MNEVLKLQALKLKILRVDIELLKLKILRLDRELLELQRKTYE